MTNRALLVGNERFDDPELASLPGASADVRALASLLERPDIGGYEVQKVLDEPVSVVLRRLEGFFGAARADDVLLLHISTHGRKNLRNQLSMACSDTDVSLLASTAVSAGFINDQIDGCRSKAVILLLDCCYSGAYSRGLVARSGSTIDTETLPGKGRVVFTASTALQFAHEGDVTSRAHAQPSVFTQAIIAGLESGAADVDGDGLVSADELWQFIDARIRRSHPQQTPTRTVTGNEGSIIIARNPDMSSALLPLDLYQALRAESSWMRRGALHELQSYLSSVRPGVKTAAAAVLHGLRADGDPAVASHARQLMAEFGLTAASLESESREPPEAVESRVWDAVGIDFGTTNTTMAIYDNGDVRVVTFPSGKRASPSLAIPTLDGTWLVGEDAKRESSYDPEHTFRSTKLRLGTDWTAQAYGRAFTAEEVCSEILRGLRGLAETATGARIDRAIVTVPAYFTLIQREALVRAMELGGVRVMRVLCEPTAAAVAYGAQEIHETTVLVFDLGGGTLDVSLLNSDFDQDGFYTAMVRATSGDNHLGGDDWDRAIVEWIRERFLVVRGAPLRLDPGTTSRVRDVAERAKIELSSQSLTVVRLLHVQDTESDEIVSLEEPLTREELTERTRHLLERARSLVRQVLVDAELAPTDVDNLVLVGGGSRVPDVAKMVESELGGLAAQPQVIPDGVAIGAALNAAVLTGHSKNVLILDVVPLDLGIADADGHMHVVILRNTTIPTKRTEMFTLEAQQEAVLLDFYQGSRRDVDENTLLGSLELDGLAADLHGRRVVAVTIDIDANGLVHLDSRDAVNPSGPSQTIDVTRETAARAAATRSKHPRPPAQPRPADDGRPQRTGVLPVREITTPVPASGATDEPTSATS